MAYTSNLHTQEAEAGLKQTQDLTLWLTWSYHRYLHVNSRYLLLRKGVWGTAFCLARFLSGLYIVIPWIVQWSILNPGTHLQEGKTKMHIKCLVTRLKKLSHVKAHHGCTLDRLTEGCLSLAPFFSHSLAFICFSEMLQLKALYMLSKLSAAGPHVRP